MLGKSILIALLVFFTSAIAQSDKARKDSTVKYIKTLAECKTLADSTEYFRTNAAVNLALLKLRNDSAISRFLRDSSLVKNDTLIQENY